MATRRRPYIIQVDEEEDDEDQHHEAEDDDDEEEGDEEEDEEEDGDVEDADPSYVPDMASPQAPDTPTSSTAAPVLEAENREGREETGTVASSDRQGIGESFASGPCSQREVDGLCCPICMQAWTSNGGHHVCCLPCGHIYGMSCIKKWLRQRRSSSKCPQCNRKCTLKDVTKLYASRIVVLDEQAQQEIQSLEAKCASLEAKCISLESETANWLNKEADWCHREANLIQQLDQLTKKSSYLQQALEDTRNRSTCFVDEIGSKVFLGEGCFMLQEELHLPGARLFDLDASRGLLIVARRHPNMAGLHFLTKFSLTPPYASEDLVLSPPVKFVKDLHVSPNGGLVLLASLGKKLSVLSLNTNNAVLTYDLPAPAWSCSWDLQSSYHIYTGLQNGMLLIFDTRQTTKPLQSFSTFTTNPVHTVYSLRGDNSPVLAVSSTGLCESSSVHDYTRPMLLDHEGVCISAAYSPSTDHIVSTYRPKVDLSSSISASQYSATPCSSEHQVQGCHVLFQRKCNCSYEKVTAASADVDEIRLTRSAIACGSSSSGLFAYPDDATSQLVLYELTSFAVVQRLKSHGSPIRDVKFMGNLNVSGGLLGCLSERSIQLYSPST